MTKFKKLALSVAIASSLSVVGCGGGGGSSSSSTPVDSGSAVVTGTAVKGILKNAVVTAYELNDVGERLAASVGTTTTDENGDYKLELSENYSGGLLEIVITAGDNTRMVCDASACGNIGEDVTLPQEFELTAIATADASDNTVSVPVTAWSTMAAKRAKALVNDNTRDSLAAAFKQASAEVEQVAGFDVVNTPARAVTDLDDATAEEAQAAVMNAVVAELVFGDSLPGDSVAEKLKNFASALEDGDIDSEDGFTPDALATVTQAVAEDTSGLPPETQDLINNLVGKYDSAGDSLAPEYDPSLELEEGAGQAEKIAAFQQFTEQFRTWATSINDTAEALRDNESTISTALDADVDTLNDVFTQAGVTGDLISKVLDAFTQQLAGEENRAALADALENGGTYTADQDWTDEQDASVSGTMDATLTFENTEDGLKATVTGEVSQTEGESRTFDFELTTSLTPDDLDLDTGKVLALLTENTVSVEGSVKDGAEFERASFNLHADLELSESLNDVSEETVLEGLSAVELTGNITLADPEAASFTGEISAKAVAMTGSSFGELDIPFSPESFSLSGDFTATSGRTFNLSASLNNNSAQRFNLFTYLDYNDTTAYFDFDVDREEVEQFVEFQSISGDYYFDIIKDGYCWNGETDAYGERVAYVDGYNPEIDQWDSNCNILDDAESQALDALVLSQLEGAVPEDLLSQLVIDDIWVGGNSEEASAYIDADIEFPSLETADNFLNLSVNLSAGVELVDLPKATAVVTVTRNALSGGSILTNVTWDGGTYSLKVSSEDLDAEEPQVSLEFWNPQGFSLKAVGTESSDGEQSLTGDVYIDGEDIGDVTLRNGVPVIVYPNGDEDIFETLF